MPTFQGLPRAILNAVSELSGDAYRAVEGDELQARLAEKGYTPDVPTAVDVMFMLRDQGEYLTWNRRAGGTGAEVFYNIRLAREGLQEVQGWPKPGGGTDLAPLLLALLDEEIEDDETPEPEKGRLRRLRQAAGGVGQGVLTDVLTKLFERQAGLG